MISNDGRDHESAVVGPWIAAQVAWADRGREPSPAASAQCRVPFRTEGGAASSFRPVALDLALPAVAGRAGSVVVIQPETVVRWHRRGFKAFRRWKSRGRPGRPRFPREVGDLIREVSLANPLGRAPRIHGELLKPGIEISQMTVAK